MVNLQITYLHEYYNLSVVQCIDVNADELFAAQLSMMEGDLRRKEQEYEVKLESLEDSSRHTMAELRQMLAQQQRMSAKYARHRLSPHYRSSSVLIYSFRLIQLRLLNVFKTGTNVWYIRLCYLVRWKEECNTLTKRFEEKLAELRSNLTSERKRTTELTRLLKESTCKTAETQQMLAEYTHSIKRMEERVRDAENRAATSSMHVRATSITALQSTVIITPPGYG